MKKKIILINAAHAEEKRVAIVEGERLADFYVESSGREHLKGNIYKGKVLRIEPGLQAAFVDFGQKKNGFLQMREIKPEYFSTKTEGKKHRIQDVLQKGQELIVQVEKDERDTKGASLTTYLSIPGRYIVMMPGQDKVGVSRKIEDRGDRDRLKEMFKALKLPKDMGFILRTAGGDKTGEDLENDLKYLIKLWKGIQAQSKKVKAPALIYKEHDIAVRTIRDYLTSDVSEVLIDDQSAYKNTKEFLKKTIPWRKINVRHYKDSKPIFAQHNIEDQISRINDRYVYLPSRGYLVIDKTEALTAIDVNSGRSRKEENIESTALKTNLEAADEIARQLRLRDIGGLIVMDFIDMVSSKNRRELEKRLKDALSSDKAHTDISGISKFGIIEMTRERMRTAYFESINRQCTACGGTGIIKTDEMVAISAFRDIHNRLSGGGIKGLTCRMPVESLNYFINAKRDELSKIEKEFNISIIISADVKLQAGQYEIEVEKAEKHGGETHHAREKGGALKDEKERAVSGHAPGVHAERGRHHEDVEKKGVAEHEAGMHKEKGRHEDRKERPDAEPSPTRLHEERAGHETERPAGSSAGENVSRETAAEKGQEDREDNQPHVKRQQKFKPRKKFRRWGKRRSGGTAPDQREAASGMGDREPAVVHSHAGGRTETSGEGKE